MDFFIIIVYFHLSLLVSYFIIFLAILIDFLSNEFIIDAFKIHQGNSLHYLRHNMNNIWVFDYDSRLFFWENFTILDIKVFLEEIFFEVLTWN